MAMVLSCLEISLPVFASLGIFPFVMNHCLQTGSYLFFILILILLQKITFYVLSKIVLSPEIKTKFEVFVLASCILRCRAKIFRHLFVFFRNEQNALNPKCSCSKETLTKIYPKDLKWFLQRLLAQIIQNVSV